MKINFDQIEEIVIPHLKGGEGETSCHMFFDGANKIMRGLLMPGCTIGYHKHETSSEIIFILNGEARCLYDDGEERLLPRYRRVYRDYIQVVIGFKFYHRFKN